MTMKTRSTRAMIFDILYLLFIAVVMAGSLLALAAVVKVARG